MLVISTVFFFCIFICVIIDIYMCIYIYPLEIIRHVILFSMKKDNDFLFGGDWSNFTSLWFTTGFAVTSHIWRGTGLPTSETAMHSRAEFTRGAVAQHAQLVFWEWDGNREFGKSYNDSIAEFHVYFERDRFANSTGESLLKSYLWRIQGWQN